MSADFKLAEAFVQLTVRGQQQVTTAVEGVRSNVSKLSKMNIGSLDVGRLLGMAGFASAGAAVGATLNYIKNATLESEEVQSRLDAALRAAGDSAGYTASQIESLSQEILQLTTFDDEAAKSAAAVMLTFRNINGDNFRKTMMAAADFAAFMHTDLETAARSVGRALNDPVRGMMLLRRQGVVLGESQESLVKQFVKTGEVAKAQDVLLQGLAGRMGGQAAAQADTFRGKVKQLANEFQNLAEAAGAAAENTTASLVGGKKGVMSGGLSMLRGATEFMNNQFGVTAANYNQADTDRINQMKKIHQAVMVRHNTKDARELIDNLEKMPIGTIDVFMAQQKGIEKYKAQISKLEGGSGPIGKYQEGEFFKTTKEEQKAAEKRKDQRDKWRGVRRTLRDKGAGDSDLANMAADAFAGDTVNLLKRIRELKNEKEKTKTSAFVKKFEADIDKEFKAGLGPNRSKGIRDLKINNPQAYDKLKNASLDAMTGMMFGGVGGAVAAATAVSKKTIETTKDLGKSETMGVSDIYQKIAGGIDYKDKKKDKTTEAAENSQIAMGKAAQGGSLKVVISNPQDITGAFG